MYEAISEIDIKYKNNSNTLINFQEPIESL